MNAILSIIAALFRWLANRSEPAAMARRDREALEVTNQEIAREVKSHDKDAVNARMQDLLKVFAVLMVITGAGCLSKPYPVYVNSTDEIVPLGLVETIGLAREKVDNIAAQGDRQQKAKVLVRGALADAAAAAVILDRDVAEGWYVPDPMMVKIQEKLAERKMMIKQGVK